MWGPGRHDIYTDRLRQINRQTDGDRKRQTDTQIDTQLDRQTCGKPERQTEIKLIQ